MKSRHRSAFTLIELVACLAMILIAINVSARLFVMVMKIYRDTPTAAQQLQLQTQWLTTLRADAWSAQNDYLFDGSQLTLVVDSKPVVWRQDGGTLIRQNGDERREWLVPRRLRWTRDASLLTVTDGEAHLSLPTPTREAATP